MHNRYDFRFGDLWLSEMNCFVSSPVDDEMPKRDITEIKIPGRDGAEIIDNGRYDAVEFTREITAISGNGYTAAEKIEKVIKNYAYLGGYQVFEDTHHPGFFTYAVLKEVRNISNSMRMLKKVSLLFSRQPYWYLYAGQEEKLLFTGGDQSKVLINPFPSTAKPVLYVYFDTSESSGTYTINISTTVNGHLKNIRIRQVGVSYTSANHIVKIDFSHQMVTLISESGMDMAVFNVDIPSEIGQGEITFTSQTCVNVEKITCVPNWRSL